MVGNKKKKRLSKEQFDLIADSVLEETVESSKEQSNIFHSSTNYDIYRRASLHEDLMFSGGGQQQTDNMANKAKKAFEMGSVCQLCNNRGHSAINCPKR